MSWQLWKEWGGDLSILFRKAQWWDRAEAGGGEPWRWTESLRSCAAYSENCCCNEGEGQASNISYTLQIFSQAHSSNKAQQGVRVTPGLTPWLWWQQASHVGCAVPARQFVHGMHDGEGGRAVMLPPLLNLSQLHCPRCFFYSRGGVKSWDNWSLICQQQWNIFFKGLLWKGGTQIAILHLRDRSCFQESSSVSPNESVVLVLRKRAMLPRGIVWRFLCKYLNRIK